MVFANGVIRSELNGGRSCEPLTPVFSEWVVRIEPGRIASVICGGAKSARETGLVAPICRAEFVGPVAGTGVVDESGIVW